MDIKILNLCIYIILIAVSLYCFCFGIGKPARWIIFVRQHYILLIILFVANSVSLFLSLQKQQESIHITRQSYDGVEKEYSFIIKGDENESEFVLKVAPRRLEPKEVKEKMEEAFLHLDTSLKGGNKSLEEVKTDLNISLPHEEYPFDVEVIPLDYSLVNEDGIVRNEEVQLMESGFNGLEMLSGIKTGIKIVLWYGEEKREKLYELIIFPREKSEWEKSVASVKELYEKKEDESVYEKEFDVPALYDGINVISSETTGITPFGALLIGVLTAGLLFLREAEMKKRRQMLRKQELLYAYPWFVNELVLLLGAGMQIKNIFSLLVNETENMKSGDHRRYLIEELKSAIHGFKIGMSEGRIYYELGTRLQLPCYVKIMTLLEQNVTKGGGGLLTLLEQEERSALEERMNLAKKRGEEAGTKLLGPMILLLLIVMLMIMIPAFLSFS